MSESGTRPNVPVLQRRILRWASALTTPLLPDDYLEMINPLWSTRELRGRVESVDRETEDAVTVTIKPGYEWMGHQPGQYLRIGFDIDGRRHWRAYSITSDPGREDGCISITPKLVEEGQVSPFIVRELGQGSIVGLGGVEGEFRLPDPVPEKMMFLSLGSGVTPIMAMLRDLERRGSLADVIHVHSARDEDDVIFGKYLRELASKHEGMQLHEHYTGQNDRIVPADLDDLCPDWRDRHCFCSGPGELLDDLVEHFDQEGVPDQLHMERFQPKIGGDGGGEGGTVSLMRSDIDFEVDGDTPILVAGEEAGADMPYGCRMGICRSCVGKLKSGQLRDLRSGEVYGSEGELVRTCVSAPEGHVELQL